MEAKREKRFYWVEGVTRDEVVRSLSDRRPTRLREQGMRRALVMGYAALVLLQSASQVWMDWRKGQSYTEIFALVGLLVLYFVLRKSVRHIADAPDELLDERLISLRNAGYLVAYRWLSFAVFPLVLLVYRLGGQEGGTSRLVSAVAIPYLMLAMALPSMVLAWQLPSERAEEASGTSQA
ncbi:MAG: hypothetical protein ACOYNR_13370 [Blastocatellia bacterium]|jgi:hypothetical protein